MKPHLSDIVDSLWEHIMGVMQGDNGEICAYYLRISYQKCLFAEERLKSLTWFVDEYNKKLNRRQILDSLSLAMDYDHLLVSLRSVLKNLAKLIGFTLSSNSPDIFIAHQQNFNLSEIVSILKNNPNLSDKPYAVKLLSFLDEKIEQNWHKDLVEPGLIISYDKFRAFPRVSPRDINQQLLDFRFLFPDALEKERNGHGSIITFCKKLIEEVEDVFSRSCQLIEKHFAHY
ncbi:hypothetical protein ACFLVP_00185 [Chloroflexota bacterium]